MEELKSLLESINNEIETLVHYEGYSASKYEKLFDLWKSNQPKPVLEELPSNKEETDLDSELEKVNDILKTAKIVRLNQQKPGKSRINSSKKKTNSASLKQPSTKEETKISAKEQSCSVKQSDKVSLQEIIKEKRLSSKYLKFEQLYKKLQTKNEFSEIEFPCSEESSFVHNISKKNKTIYTEETMTSKLNSLTCRHQNLIHLVQINSTTNKQGISLYKDKQVLATATKLSEEFENYKNFLMKSVLVVPMTIKPKKTKFFNKFDPNLIGYPVKFYLGTQKEMVLYSETKHQYLWLKFQQFSTPEILKVFEQIIPLIKDKKDFLDTLSLFEGILKQGSSVNPAVVWFK